MVVFTDFLGTIPNIVWTGLFGALIALSGVLVADWNNTKRLRIQLSHDAKEKAKDRTSSLRQDVYGAFAEELTKANFRLGCLPQSDFTKTNIADEFQDFFAAAAKLQLVAEPKTALLVNQLIADFSGLFFQLTARLRPLQKARTNISTNEEMYNKAQLEVTRILAEMTKFNEGAKTDGVVFSALQQSFTYYQDQSINYANARSEGWKEFHDLNVEFARRLMKEIKPIAQKHIPLMIEIRRDLGLTTDLCAYQKQIDANWVRMNSQIDTLLQSLQEDALPNPSVQQKS